MKVKKYIEEDFFIISSMLSIFFVINGLAGTASKYEANTKIQIEINIDINLYLTILDGITNDFKNSNICILNTSKNSICKYKKNMIK